MKKLKVTAEKALAIYRILRDAKYQKLEDTDKIKVWKITRNIRPIAEKFEEDVQDANSKFKPKEDFNERLSKAKEYERMLQKGEKELPITAEEYSTTVKEFNQYKNLIEQAIKEYAEQESEIEIEPLTEDALGKLMASNDWTIAQVEQLEEIIL